MNFTLLTTAIAAAVGFVAGGALAWQLQAGNIATINLGAANERIAIQRAARQTLERNQATVAAAQANATKRGISHRADISAVASVAGGLRISTAAAVRNAADNPAVCSDAAATLGKLFDASVKEYRELAERSDRHVIDIKAMTEREER